MPEAKSERRDDRGDLGGPFEIRARQIDHDGQEPGDHEADGDGEHAEEQNTARLVDASALMSSVGPSGPRWKAVKRTTVGVMPKSSNRNTIVNETMKPKRRSLPGRAHR